LQEEICLFKEEKNEMINFRELREEYKNRQEGKGAKTTDPPASTIISQSQAKTLKSSSEKVFETVLEIRMAKSKNHTAHNQNHKAHRNRIIKPNIREEMKKKKGMCMKFLKNQRFARLGTIKALKAQKNQKKTDTKKETAVAKE